MGARSNGLGYASSCIRDEWAICNNVAGLAGLEQITAAFSYDAHPSLSAFNRIAATCVAPFKYGTAGFSIFRFGDSNYNEHMLSLGFANTFGIASLGLRLNYIQYNADGFGTKGVVSIGLGGITRLTSMLRVGTFITNVNQPEIDAGTGERLPARITAGLSYRVSEKVTLIAEVEKDLDYKPLWKGAIEYALHKKISARTGFNINPDAAFFGLGFSPGRITLDYAFQFNVLSGSSHQATIGYPLKKKKQ